MKLTKQDIADIKDFGRASKIVHDYAIMLKVRFRERGFNADFINENIESLLQGDIDAGDLIEILESKEG